MTADKQITKIEQDSKLDVHLYNRLALKEPK